MFLLIVGTFLFIRESYPQEKYHYYLNYSYNEKDSIVIELINDINVDSIKYFIQKLQDFKTRYTFCSNRDSVSEWILRTIKRFGYNIVDYDSFWINDNDGNPTLQRNVITTVPGINDDDEIIILGAHYDSFSYDSYLTEAPGADDNASGTAAILEIARVLKEKNYIPKSSIKLINFAAEEVGRKGSQYYSTEAYDDLEYIKFMMNVDMIGYNSKPLNESEININYYNGFINFREFAFKSFTPFSAVTPIVGTLSEASDSYSFYKLGVPSIGFFETDFTPYYHTKNDVLANIDIEYCKEVVKGICATLIYASDTPPNVKNLKVSDAGNGNSLICTWDKINNDEITYKIYIGKQSGFYDTSYITSDNHFIAGNLLTDTTYYIGIASVDENENESLFKEKRLVPKIIPGTPNAFCVKPALNKIELKWNSNTENDLNGYNIYRSSTLEGVPYKINSKIVSDTFYIDNNLQKCEYYYYSITAVDSQLNESKKTETIKSRAITLDQGILVIDETKDGTGAILNPTDEQVDTFFTDILENFNKKDFDITKDGNITLADMGAFSTIFWQANDANNILKSSAVREDIKSYLSCGGKLFFNGHYPSRVLDSNTVYPQSYTTGDFLYDVMKIKGVEWKFSSKFYGATSNNLYPSIFVDTLKTKKSSKYHLSDIESIEAAPGAEEIYFYHTQYDSTTAQGSMKGMPVGIEYLGDDYKLVVLSFPLYYMEKEEAKELVQNILLNKFNETTKVEEKKEELKPTNYCLYQNYPNPFNPTTKIKYFLPEESYVELKIYDLMGKEVKNLISGNQKPGYREVVWNGRNNNREQVTSGVYFYRLRTNSLLDGRWTEKSAKLVLLK